MVTSKDCFKKYGDPSLENNMVILNINHHVITALPRRIYCNEDMFRPLNKAFDFIIERSLEGQIKTWDGCFNIRKKRGAVSQSLHSWGIAIDINAAWNQFGKPPTMSKELVQCFKDAGFDWGGDWGLGAAGNWKGCDAMHFQLKNLP